MIRTIHKAVTAATVTEELVDLVTGGAGFKRKILGVFYETIANVHFRLYIGTDRVMELSGDIVNDAAQPIMLNHELQDGETVQVGWYNATGGEVTHDISVQIDETPTV